MTKFQLILLLFFAATIFVAVLMFAGAIPTPGGNEPEPGEITAELTMWGSLPSLSMNRLMRDFNTDAQGNYRIRYTQFDPETLELELLRAITEGRSPDLILFSQESYITLEKHLFPIPSEYLNARAFRQLFIEGSEIYVEQDGIRSLPFLVDPIVLYWNRDVFTTNTILSPPTYWEDLFVVTEKLTERDNQGTISFAGVALGEAGNVTHFKDIFSAMMQQVDNPIVARNESGALTSVFGKNVSDDSIISPALTSLTFYTDFSNPQKRRYSWNSSLPDSINSFAATLLAMYMGKASDLPLIRDLNPHINFDVAVIPQIKGDERRATQGDIIGIGVLSSSQSVSPAIRALSELTNRTWAQQSSDLFKLPPARRDILSENHPDPFVDSFYQSAIITKTWIDPDDAKTDEIFADMINKVNARAISPTTAIQNVHAQLETLLEE